MTSCPTTVTMAPLTGVIALVRIHCCGHSLWLEVLTTHASNVEFLSICCNNGHVGLAVNQSQPTQCCGDSYSSIYLALK